MTPLSATHVGAPPENASVLLTAGWLSGAGGSWAGFAP